MGAEHEADADADAAVYYGGYYGYPRAYGYGLYNRGYYGGYYGYPYSYGYGYARHFGKRSADAEPEADADAAVYYGGYYGHPYRYGGYYGGYPYRYGGYYGYGGYGRYFG